MLPRRTFLASAIATWVAGSECFARAADAKVHLAVVVAKTSPIAEFSFHELKRLYLGEQTRSSEGSKVIPLNQGGKSEDRVGFERVLLGMAPDQISAYWIDRKIRGQSGPPKSVDSVDLLRRLIARVDGTVGYIRVNDLTADLKAVRIEGKMPADSGYPIAY